MTESLQPGEVLSVWRTRALPQDPAEKAVHHAILRTFAVTGQPPTRGELDAVTADAGRTTAATLAGLHDLDAIRLDPDGQIAVAYPFSAAPTRHRVRIGHQHEDGIEAYAMCAIDALGISAMLDTDTRIHSVDATTGQPVTVTIRAGGADEKASWDPAGAVVFVGGDAGGGPSAECCCDYLNFFTDETAAKTWTAAHPHVPGQILTQAVAEDLAARLFGPLLTT